MRTLPYEVLLTKVPYVRLRYVLYRTVRYRTASTNAETHNNMSSLLDQGVPLKCPVLPALPLRNTRLEYGRSVAYGDEPEPPWNSIAGSAVRFDSLMNWSRDSGMVLERWSRRWPVEDGSGITLRGSQRAYLARFPSTAGMVEPGELAWKEITYDKLRLLGKTLYWSIDVSRVPCGCNAAFYLSAMPQPDASGSQYCDINTPPTQSGDGDGERCVEIDLFEGNLKAMAVTVHTKVSNPPRLDECNEWGCSRR